MPLKNIATSLKGALLGRIKKPVEDLVEKVKKQDLRVPQLRIEHIEKPLQKYEAAIPTIKAPEPLKTAVPLLRVPEAVRNLPRIGLSFLNADPDTLRETREAQDILKRKYGTDPESDVFGLDVYQFSNKKLREDLDYEDYVKVRRFKARSGMAFMGSAPQEGQMDPEKKITALMREAETMRAEQDVRPKEMGEAYFIDAKGQTIDVAEHKAEFFGENDLRVVTNPNELNIETKQGFLPDQINTLKRMFSKIQSKNPNVKVIVDTPSGSGVFKSIDELITQQPKLKVKPLDPEKKITALMREAETMRAEQDVMYSRERAIRSERIAEAGERVSGEAGFLEQLKVAKGELPKVQFSRIRQHLSQTDVDSLFNKIEDNMNLLPYEKLKTKGALAKLLGEEGGVVPQKAEIELLSQVFSEEFINTIKSKGGPSRGILENVAEVLNVPRAIMASFDLSAPLRQGLFLVGRPKQWVPALKDMFKYFVSEDSYDDLYKNIRSRDTYELMVDSGLELTDMKSPMLTKREEAFMSNLAEKIPGVGRGIRASNRAYTGFLNKLRADTFDDMIRGSKALGVPQTPQLHNDISNFVNTATGRGSLGRFEGSATVLNTTFFSPRLLSSRIHLLRPDYYVKLHPYVRKQALKSLITFAGLGTTVLALADMGGAEVGTDPTSADFGKIKIGNTRFDIWGGFQQPVRLAAQLISGKVTSTVTGKTITLGEGYKPLTREDIFFRFFESKEAPIMSFIHSLAKGQTFTGEPVDIPEEVIERFMPMVLGGMYEMYQEGELGLLWWLPSVFGVGTQTYGKQELLTGVDALGEPTVEVKPVKGMAAKIREKLFGQPTLKPSSGFSITAYEEQLSKMPKEKASMEFNRIARENPELAEKILDAYEDRVKGVTVEDKALKEKGVSSGERALEIHKQLKELKTDKERSALWKEYVDKKIITEEVGEQLYRLIQKEKKPLEEERTSFIKDRPEGMSEDQANLIFDEVKNALLGTNILNPKGAEAKTTYKDETLEVGGPSVTETIKLGFEKVKNAVFDFFKKLKSDEPIVLENPNISEVKAEEQPTATPSPTATPTPELRTNTPEGRTSRGKEDPTITPWNEEIKKEFGKEWVNATRVLAYRDENEIIRGENVNLQTGPNVDAKNNDGSIDRGLFRINSYTFEDFMRRKKNLLKRNGIESYEDMYDVEKNIKMAKIIYDEQGWRAWYGAPPELQK